VPMLPEYVWLHVLGETAASMAAWPAGKLASKQLNAIANMEGANTAEMTQPPGGLRTFMVWSSV